MKVNITLSNGKWTALAKGVAGAAAGAALAYVTGHSSEFVGAGGGGIVLLLEGLEAVLNFGTAPAVQEPVA